MASACLAIRVTTLPGWALSAPPDSYSANGEEDGQGDEKAGHQDQGHKVGRRRGYVLREVLARERIPNNYVTLKNVHAHQMRPR